MAGLFLLRDDDPQLREEAMAKAEAQFRLHGFTRLSRHEVGGWSLLHAPHILGGPQNLLVEGDHLVAVAGTLTVDGQMGAPALRELLRMGNLPAPDWNRIGGHFAALVHTGGRTFLFTDFFSAFQVFHDTGMRFFSTSLLAATQATPRLSFDTQAVYEFVLNVAPIGDDTIFSEVKTLGPDRVVELTPRGAVPHSIAKPLPEVVQEIPIDERLRRHRERLMSVVETHVRAFGNDIYCPLSGGLDSRLVLAAIRAAGSNPHLYVYGNRESRDVEIARAIAAAEGTPIEWIDKLHYRDVSPDAFSEQVARNFQAYDATPNFGALFENGANDMARSARHRNGALSASGGCGEIYRNFFFLPDRRFTSADIVRTFYARYTKSDMTEAFDERRFLSAMAAKVRSAVGRGDDRDGLPRAVVEQVYPRIRCRALFGKEISMEGRCAAYLMPFLDQHVVAEAMTLPLPLKNAGRFEARLLAAIDPVLAAHQSAYGHSFTDPPGRAHRFSEWSTRIRPIWLRQKSYQLRRWRGPLTDEHGGLLTPDFMSRVVNLDYPVMRKFFNTDRIADAGMMRRIANLEYLADHLGSKLRPS